MKEEADRHYLSDSASALTGKNGKVPKTTEAWHDAGVGYAEAQEYDKALLCYTQAIEIDPENALAYNNRGLVYAWKNDYDNAIADFTQALQINPNHVKAYNNRGYTYFLKGDYDNAIADYTEALRIDPSYTKAAEGIEEAKAASKTNVVQARFCEECGAKLENGAKFCAECGTAVH